MACVALAALGAAQAAAAASDPFVWSDRYSADTTNQADAVACPSVTRCIAVDGAGYEPTLNPQSATPTVSNQQTTLSVTAPAAGTTGTAISASSVTATLANATADPATTIQFIVFGPQSTAPTSCTNPATEGGTTVGFADPSGSGTYHPSADFTPPTAGNYWWYAIYTGGFGTFSACGAGMPETTVTGVSLTSLSLSAPPSGTAGVAIPGSSVSAVLSGGSTPGGGVAFSVFGPSASAPTSCDSGGQLVGTAPVSGDGTYHPSAGFTPTGAGDYWWYASYGGDAGNGGSHSACGAGMPETVVGAATSLSLSVPSSGTEGVAIPGSSVSAVLSGGSSPGGTVTFSVYGPQANAPTSCGAGWQVVGTGSVSGNGTYHPSAGFTPVTGAGNYWWYASYNGDAANGGSHSACGAGMPETVISAALPSTSLSLSVPSSGTAGAAIPGSAVSAVLLGGSAPGGTVIFSVFGPSASAPTSCDSGGQVVDSVAVSGDGTYRPSAGFTPRGAGNYWWYASYGGDAGNGGSHSACGAGMPETVISAALSSTSLSLSVPSSGTAGVAIPGSSVSAVLSGGSTPGGTVIFSVFGPSASAPTSCDSGWQVVGTAPVSGDGTYHPPAGFTPTGAGNYWWYATYGGDAGNGGAQSVCGAGATETAVGTAGTGTTGTVKLVRVTVSGTRVHLVLSCSGGPCAGTLNIAAIEHLKARTPTAIVATGRKPHGKPRTKSIVLASGRYAIAENASQAAALTLSRQATRLLKKLHRISGKLTVLPAGAATPTVTRTIRFKSPKQR